LAPLASNAGSAENTRCTSVASWGTENLDDIDLFVSVASPALLSLFHQLTTSRVPVFQL